MSAGAAFSPRRWGYIANSAAEFLTITCGWVSREVCVGVSDADPGPLDAPPLIAGGACVDLSPFWFPGDVAPQVIVRRGGVFS